MLLNNNIEDLILYKKTKEKIKILIQEEPYGSSLLLNLLQNEGEILMGKKLFLGIKSLGFDFANELSNFSNFSKGNYDLEKIVND